MTTVRAARRSARPRSVTCPYRGLLPFSEDEARYFFGRDADREIIAANLIATRLTLLYSPSGVGKTSVLLAGVAHDLRELAQDGALDGHGPEYLPVVVRRWSGDPIAAIDDALRTSAERLMGAVPDPAPAEERLVDRLRHWAVATDTTLLIVLDQFEEFLLYHGTAWEPGGAAREIAQALSARDLPANFLLGLREDALASLDRFKGRVPYLFDNYLRLAHLDADAARDAVHRPLEQWSKDHPDDPMAIEPELVDTLLEEVTTGRITLGRTGAGVAAADVHGVETPFLQLVLTRLWEEERAQGSRCMRSATLRALGGAAEVVQTHLDVRMSALTRPQRDVAAAVFHQLVTPSRTKVARSLDDLAAYTGVPAAQIEPVMRTLSQGDWRIVRSVTEPGTGHGTLRGLPRRARRRDPRLARAARGAAPADAHGPPGGARRLRRRPGHGAGAAVRRLGAAQEAGGRRAARPRPAGEPTCDVARARGRLAAAVRPRSRARRRHRGPRRRGRRVAPRPCVRYAARWPRTTCAGRSRASPEQSDRCGFRSTAAGLRWSITNTAFVSGRCRTRSTP